MNCSSVSATVPLRLAGLRQTTEPTLAEDSGSGSTPLTGAGSIATAASASPRPTRICVIMPPNEWPITIGLRSSAVITSAKWLTTSATPYPAMGLGLALVSSMVAASPGHGGATGAYPRSANSSTQGFQLVWCSQRPWTNTTGVAVLGICLAPWATLDGDFPSSAPA